MCFFAGFGENHCACFLRLDSAQFADNAFDALIAVVETVLRQLLADVQDHVTLLLGHRVTNADAEAGTVHSLELANGDTVGATVFVDATDLGELLPVCGVEWFIGAEAKSDTEEPHAEATAHPGHIQPFTVSLAVERRPAGETHVIPRPANYAQALIESQAFGVYGGRNGMIGGVFSSAHSENPHWETLFDYRQYIDSANFADPAYAHDRDRYLGVMRGAIAFNASHFNAQRMLAQYAIEAYDLPVNTAAPPEHIKELLAG